MAQGARAALTPAELSLIDAVGEGAIWSPVYFREWQRRKAATAPPPMFDAGGPPHAPIFCP